MNLTKATFARVSSPTYQEPKEGMTRFGNTESLVEGTFRAAVVTSVAVVDPKTEGKFI